MFYFFAGPVIPEGASGAESAQSFYFVYNITPKKDYLYFKVSVYSLLHITIEYSILLFDRLILLKKPSLHLIGTDPTSKIIYYIYFF